MENGFHGSKTVQQNHDTEAAGRGGGRVGLFRSFKVDMILRTLGLGLTLIASIIVGVDKQTTVVPVSVISTLPPLNVPVTAKSAYLSAFVYFVVANAVACAYSAISLLLTIISSKRRSASAIIVILDMMVAVLLFSANGAAGAIGMIGFEGNSHLRWKKVCHVFDKFCDRMAVALVLSFIASLVFLLLIASAVWRLRKS